MPVWDWQRVCKVWTNCCSVSLKMCRYCKWSVIYTKIEIIQQNHVAGKRYLAIMTIEDVVSVWANYGIYVTRNLDIPQFRRHSIFNMLNFVVSEIRLIYNWIHSKDHKDQNYDAYKDGNIFWVPKAPHTVYTLPPYWNGNHGPAHHFQHYFLNFKHHMVSTGNSLLSAKLGDTGTPDKGFRG